MRVDETLLCVANLGAEPRTTRLLLSLPGLHDGLPVEDLLAGGRVPVEQSAVRLDLLPYEVRLLIPRDDAASGYRFWK